MPSKRLLFFPLGGGLLGIFLFLFCVLTMFPLCSYMFSMCSPRVFPIIPHFYPIWFAQSCFLLSYIVGPNRRHCIFTWKLLFWGPSRVSMIYLFLVLFFFFAWWANQNGSFDSKKKSKKKGNLGNTSHLFNKIMTSCCVLY